MGVNYSIKRQNLTQNIYIDILYTIKATALQEKKKTTMFIVHFTEIK